MVAQAASWPLDRSIARASGECAITAVATSATDAATIHLPGRHPITMALSFCDDQQLGDVADHCQRGDGVNLRIGKNDQREPLSPGSQNANEPSSLLRKGVELS
jgi:hypothetical protein